MHLLGGTQQYTSARITHTHTRTADVLPVGRPDPSEGERERGVAFIRILSLVRLYVSVGPVDFAWWRFISG